MTNACPSPWAGHDQLWRAAAGEQAGWVGAPEVPLWPHRSEGPYIQLPREWVEGLRRWVNVKDREAKSGR